MRNEKHRKIDPQILSGISDGCGTGDRAECGAVCDSFLNIQSERKQRGLDPRAEHCGSVCPDTGRGL